MALCATGSSANTTEAYGERHRREGRRRRRQRRQLRQGRQREGRRPALEREQLAHEQHRQVGEDQQHRTTPRRSPPTTTAAAATPSPLRPPRDQIVRRAPRPRSATAPPSPPPARSPRHAGEHRRDRRPATARRTRRARSASPPASREQGRHPQRRDAPTPRPINANGLEVQAGMRVNGDDRSSASTTASWTNVPLGRDVPRVAVRRRLLPADRGRHRRHDRRRRARFAGETLTVKNASGLRPPPAPSRSPASTTVQVHRQDRQPASPASRLHRRRRGQGRPPR